MSLARTLGQDLIYTVWISRNNLGTAMMRVPAVTSFLWDDGRAESDDEVVDRLTAQIGSLVRKHPP